VDELSNFGLVVLIVAAGFTAAVALSKLTERVPVPGPALFLLLGALASDVFPGLSVLDTQSVERIGVVALIVILFDGGMYVGWRRFRSSAAPIVVLGVVGTFATAGVVAVLAHALLDLGWTSAGILGAAVAPTDPAVMFSVLGKRQIGGRSGTILEGESGANDPVGIALVIGLLELAEHSDASFWIVVREFLVQMSVGLAVGVAGGLALLPVLRRIALPSEALYPIFTLSMAGVIYGVAAVAHGSGFLAVFVAGILLGDARAPYKGEVERFHKSLASLAEMVVFAALGLTFHFKDLADDRIWLDGIVLAVLLAFVARPVTVGPLLLPFRLRWGERAFIVWGGLKGAVPILLGTTVLLAGVADAQRIDDIVVVVVFLSVLVQGTSMPFLAPRLGVRMRLAEPGGVFTVTVSAGARAAGRTIRDLPISERTWVQNVRRDGTRIGASSNTVLEPGDEVELHLDVGDVAALERLFGRQSPA
jgi:cell volume regulation protein A